VLVAAFADRVLLLERTRTTHVPSLPVAQFTQGTCTVTVTGQDRKHVDLTLTDNAQTVSLRMTRYGEDRIDGLILDAVLALNDV
jgi:hypothetical protein